MTPAIPRFDRSFFESSAPLSRVGEGSLGGKARGLASMALALAERFPPMEGSIAVCIPRTVVLTTDFFDAFMQENDLWETALAGLSDDRVGHAFQRAHLPARFVGDLQAIAAEAHQPLAVRSSSLLEDAMFRPFAGVYATKMIPNDRPDPSTRFKRLAEAVKFVIASTFFAEARRYIRSAGEDPRSEKMAVIIQEVVGQRRGERFYPSLSGVARSWNFYPCGHARPEDGVVDLALGLGKTIVDGGQAWSFSPAWPKAPPPWNNVGDMLKFSQTSFWAVNMGSPPPHDPIRETEYLVTAGLEQADYDDMLRFVASTVDPRSGRILPTVAMKGPRLLDFAPLLKLEKLPLVKLVRDLLAVCEEVVGCEVEVEFAVDLDRKQGLPARLGFLQVRPMVVSREAVEVSDDLLRHPLALVSSTHTLGNGVLDHIEDIVYLVPEAFDAAHTQRMARELQALNEALVVSGRPYVLVGFGRWGTSDPWFGVPVDWSQISGARVIVEVTLEGRESELSQGSHFFHNVTSFQVGYLSLPRTAVIAWEWLASLPEVQRTEHVRHVRAPTPLHVMLDGRRGRGVILRHVIQ